MGYFGKKLLIQTFSKGRKKTCFCKKFSLIVENFNIDIRNTLQYFCYNTMIKLMLYGNILQLTRWSRVTHICINNLTIIDSDNGFSPGRRQAIIWTNAGILLIGPLGTNFIEILIGFQTFSFKKMHLKMSSAKWRPFCLGLNVLNGS